MVKKMLNPIYDDELFLITKTIEKDGIGQSVSTEKKEYRLCATKSITRSEYYKAQVSKLSPSIVFVIKKYEYDEQNEIEYNKKRYKVIRTYSDNPEETELTCERINHVKS